MEGAQDPGREAWRLLFQLFRSHRREIIGMRNAFDLKPAQVHLLLALHEGSAPMSELAEAMVCDASYITGLVDKLEKRGLVERRPNPQDRRVKLIVLTPEGEATRVELKKNVSQPPSFIEAMSFEDKCALRDIFERAERLLAQEGA